MISRLAAAVRMAYVPRAALLVPLLLAACTTGWSSPSLPGSPPPSSRGPAPGEVHEEVARLVRLVDQHRARVGCAPLVWDARVAAVAQAHSDDMRRRGYYAHVDPDGRTPVMRLQAAGIGWRETAENIARTGFGAEQVLALWLQSRGHRANLENCRLTRHGVGLSGELWTHVFVTPG